MTLFPQTTGATVRLTALACLGIALGIFGHPDRVPRYLLSDKHEGDILFQSLPKGVLIDSIELVSNSPWSHCGILTRREEQWFVAEAGLSVKYTPLFDWICQGRGFFVDSYRVRGITPEQESKVQPGIAKFLGKAYDIEFREDDKKIYCSELVYKVYDRDLGIKLGKWERLGDLNWKAAESFIRSMERGKLPLERDLITPVGLTKGDNLMRVFTNRP